MIDAGADPAVVEAIREQIAADDFGGSSFLCDCDALNDTLPGHDAPGYGQSWLDHDPTCRGRCYAAISG